MKNFNQTNEFQVEKLEERLEMASWDDCVTHILEI